MKSKTCGECHFYNPKITRNDCGMCTTGRFKGRYVDPSMKACAWPIGGSKRHITNGEKLWQSGYEEVITFCKTWMQKFSCWADAEDWLNAPAESEENK